jgi:hypothetical protein
MTFLRRKRNDGEKEVSLRGLAWHDMVWLSTVILITLDILFFPLQHNLHQYNQTQTYILMLY